jgi:hypothetical protein
MVSDNPRCLAVLDQIHPVPVLLEPAAQCVRQFHFVLDK